jgi:hypothetical protein
MTTCSGRARFTPSRAIKRTKNTATKHTNLQQELGLRGTPPAARLGERVIAARLHLGNEGCDLREAGLAHCVPLEGTVRCVACENADTAVTAADERVVSHAG